MREQSANSLWRCNFPSNHVWAPTVVFTHFASWGRFPVRAHCTSSKRATTTTHPVRDGGSLVFGPLRYCNVRHCGPTLLSNGWVHFERLFNSVCSGLYALVETHPQCLPVHLSEPCFKALYQYCCIDRLYGMMAGCATLYCQHLTHTYNRHTHTHFQSEVSTQTHTSQVKVARCCRRSASAATATTGDNDNTVLYWKQDRNKKMILIRNWNESWAFIFLLFGECADKLGAIHQI